MVIQELWFLVNLAVTTSTEECYSEVLPCMAESSGCVLVHYPTVGAECNLLPLIGVIRDGDLIQALGLVEFVVFGYTCPSVQGQPPILIGEVFRLAIRKMAFLLKVWHPVLAYDRGWP